MMASAEANHLFGILDTEHLNGRHYGNEIRQPERCHFYRYTEVPSVGATTVVARR